MKQVKYAKKVSKVGQASQVEKEIKEAIYHTVQDIMSGFTFEETTDTLRKKCLLGTARA